MEHDMFLTAYSYKVSLEERQFKKSRIPQAASFSAMAFPIPWEAPVINIVFIKTPLLKK